MEFHAADRRLGPLPNLPQAGITSRLAAGRRLRPLCELLDSCIQPETDDERMRRRPEPMSLKMCQTKDRTQSRTAPESYERNIESSSEIQLINLKDEQQYEHGRTWCVFFDLGWEDSQQIDFSRETSFRHLWGGGGGGGLPRDVSLTPKNLDFSQLIICCWLKLDMPSLDMTESKIGLS